MEEVIKTTREPNVIRDFFGLKRGCKFKSKDFLGWIYITGISPGGIDLKFEHVSGSDFGDNVSVEDFKFRKISGEYYQFVRV